MCTIYTYMILSKLIKATWNKNTGRWHIGLPTRFNGLVFPNGYFCVSEGKDGTIILTPKKMEELK